MLAAMTSRRVAFSVLGCIALACCEVRVTSQPPTSTGGAMSFPIGAAGGRMLSSDGVLLATVARGSGAPPSLTVAPADLAKLKASFPEHEIAVAYDLGPDGSAFSPAVAVELDLSRVTGIEDGEVPLLWRSEGADFVLANGLEIVERDGTFVVRGEVPHFSTVVLTRGREMRLSFSSDDFVDVGQQLASSGQLSATASSQAQALGVVMRSRPTNVLSGPEDGRDFGVLTGGAQTVDRAYDPVTCLRGGLGHFDVRATFTGFTTMRNGQRTAPANVPRSRNKRVFCHDTDGSFTIPAVAGVVGSVAQTLSVSRPAVTAAVGEKFVLEISLAGRTGDQGFSFADAFPGIVSPATAATPTALGAATDVTVDASGARFKLAGTGGVRVEYECIAVGETGLAFGTTFAGIMSVTTRARCIAPPPPENEGR